MDLFARMDAIQADSNDDDEILRDLDLDNFDIDENRGSGKQYMLDKDASSAFRPQLTSSFNGSFLGLDDDNDVLQEW